MTMLRMLATILAAAFAFAAGPAQAEMKSQWGQRPFSRARSRPTCQ